MSGLRFRASRPGTRPRRKNQGCEGQRGRQSRTQSLVRDPVHPNSDLFCHGKALLPRRRNREQGGHSGQTPAFFQLSSMHSPPRNHRSNGHQTGTCRSSKTRSATGNAGRNCESPGAPRPNPSPRPNWDLIAVWSFVAVSFTALFFAVYVIWAKCRGT